MIEVAIPTPEIVEECWSQIEPFIQMVVDESHDEVSLSATKEKIGKKELLIATIFDEHELIAVTAFEIVTFETGKRVIQISAAGGTKVDLWFKEIERIATELAEVHDCTAVYVIGRAGWLRKMKHLGYKHTNTIIAKEL